MANVMVPINFQISDSTPIISLLIRVISGLKVNFKYLWDLDEMFLLSNWRMANIMVTIKVSKAKSMIRISIRVLNALDFYLFS